MNTNFQTVLPEHYLSLYMCTITYNTHTHTHTHTHTQALLTDNVEI
jgi:hypothetical protein